MKETSFALHVSCISEMLLKHLSIFASQPKEFCSTPLKSICDCSCPHGCWEWFSQANRHQKYIQFCKIIWESVLQITQRVPDIHKSQNSAVCFWQCCCGGAFDLGFFLLQTHNSWLCCLIYFQLQKPVKCLHLSLISTSIVKGSSSISLPADQ